MCSGVFASVYSFAITDAMVAAGASSDLEISGLFPINIVTAIVSPRALPKPKTIADDIPETEGEITDILIISNFVDPKA